MATLVSERLAAGQYEYDWDASGLASGVYLYRLQAGDYVEAKKMILLRVAWMVHLGGFVAGSLIGYYYKPRSLDKQSKS